MRLKFFFLLLLTPGISSGQNFITGMEYWFDTTRSSAIYQSVVPQHQFEYNATINTEGLEKGLHSYHVRFKQTNNFWSQAVSGYFFKTGQDTTPGLAINAYRYWVEALDSIVTVAIPTPVNPFDLIVTLDLSWVPKGHNYLYVQFRDEQENWSVAVADTFIKSSIPKADFTVNDTLVCTYDSVHFINNSIDGDIYQWQFGDGDSSTEAEPVHLYSVPGVYTVSLLVTDTTLGTDSMITLTDVVNVMQGGSASFSFTQSFTQVTFTNLSQNAGSYYWDFGDSTFSTDTNPVHTYLHDGNYTVVLTVYDSCNALTDTQYVSLVLPVNPITGDPRIKITQSNTHVNISILDRPENCFYRLMDPSGKLVMYDRISGRNSGASEQFSIENLPGGIYFLTVQNENYFRTRLIYKF